MPEPFLSLIVTMLPAFGEMEKRLDLETGRRFNALKLFSPNENATSRILEFLLNPTEAHGQNHIFLRLFIHRFVPDWKSEFDYSKSYTASQMDNIDVFVSDGTHWLGIENKIFGAQDQLTQASRYLDALRDLAARAAAQNDYRLVYVSPTGEGPTPQSLPDEARHRHEGHLILGTWGRGYEGESKELEEPEEPQKPPDPPASIPDWLIDCQNECRAEKVTWLIRQFAAYVHSANAGQKEPDMVDAAIVDLALKDQENLEAALRIGDSTVAIRRKVLGTFLKRIQSGLEKWVRQQDADWELLVSWPGGDWTEQPAEKWLPLLIRRKNWPAMVGAAIVAEKPGPFEVFIGVCGPTQDTWNGSERTNTRYYGPQSNFIGHESRQRIAEAIGPGGLQSGFWVHWEPWLEDSAGKDISDWRETATIMRLHSEREELCKHVVARVTGLAGNIARAMSYSGQ